MPKTLITGATVLSMDDAIGALARGDVLIDGDRIADVGENIPRPADAQLIDGADRIVMPGFVDTHRHAWAAMLRGCACYGDLGDYFRDVVFTYGANFTPDDTYTSIAFGLAEAIDSGITTLHAWEHNIQTPAHADAAVQALEDSGMRGRFSYGSSSDPEHPSSFAQGTETIDLADVLRIRRERFEGGSGRWHLGIASRGVDYSRTEVWREEFRFAREHGLPITTHTMMTSADVARVRGLSVYKEHDALGPDVLLIHAIHLDPEERAYLASSGAPVSISLLSELRTGMGIPRTSELMEAGVPISLSVDTMAASDNSDMFAVMRMTMSLERGRRENGKIYQPDQVLRHATIDGARALGLGDETGSLSPGKRADVIVLRGDDLNLAPLNVPDGQVVLAAQPRNVEHVWIDGRQVKRDGALVGVDVPGLVRSAKAAVHGLSQRVGRPLT